MPAENFIKLHEKDNVFVALRGVAKGTIVQIGANSFPTVQDVSLAHKIAARDITSGEVIYKYGMPIGAATQDISAGNNVHVHNVKSNYTATVYRAEESGVSEDSI
ncbi:MULTISPECIES: UxaA family hydrolase [Falsihalocynthiibacter]|uniref:UxaA family hydrolase n=1 Tax=Falsihalocynthiibacter TaxID=2854182 RepID=UPI0030029737